MAGRNNSSSAQHGSGSIKTVQPPQEKSSKQQAGRRPNPQANVLSVAGSVLSLSTQNAPTRKNGFSLRQASSSQSFSVMPGSKQQATNKSAPTQRPMPAGGPPPINAGLFNKLATGKISNYASAMIAQFCTMNAQNQRAEADREPPESELETCTEEDEEEETTTEDAYFNIEEDLKRQREVAERALRRRMEEASAESDCSGHTRTKRRRRPGARSPMRARLTERRKTRSSSASPAPRRRLQTGADLDAHFERMTGSRYGTQRSAAIASCYPSSDEESMRSAHTAPTCPPGYSRYARYQNKYHYQPPAQASNAKPSSSVRNSQSSALSSATVDTTALSRHSGHNSAASRRRETAAWFVELCDESAALTVSSEHGGLSKRSLMAHLQQQERTRRVIDYHDSDFLSQGEDDDDDVEEFGGDTTDPSEHCEARPLPARDAFAGCNPDSALHAERCSSAASESRIEDGDDKPTTVAKVPEEPMTKRAPAKQRTRSSKKSRIKAGPAAKRGSVTAVPKVDKASIKAAERERNGLASHEMVISALRTGLMANSKKDEDKEQVDTMHVISKEKDRGVALTDRVQRRGSVAVPPTSRDLPRVSDHMIRNSNSNSACSAASSCYAAVLHMRPLSITEKRRLQGSPAPNKPRLYIQDKAPTGRQSVSHDHVDHSGNW